MRKIQGLGNSFPSHTVPSEEAIPHLKVARSTAGLDWLRLKDLRSVFADAFVEAGGTLKDLQAVLGHSSGKTSMRYTRAQPIRQMDTMEAAAQVLGFGPRHLTVEEGSA